MKASNRLGDSMGLIHPLWISSSRGLNCNNPNVKGKGFGLRWKWQRWKEGDRFEVCFQDRNDRPYRWMGYGKCFFIFPQSGILEVLLFHFSTSPGLLLPKGGEGGEVIGQRSLVFGHPFPCGWDWETRFLCPGTAGPLVLNVTLQYGMMPTASYLSLFLLPPSALSTLAMLPLWFKFPKQLIWFTWRDLKVCVESTAIL